MEKITLALKEHKNRLRLEKLRQSRKHRKIFVFNVIDENWELTDFERLNDGDFFKIIQDGVRYTDPDTGDNVWVAKGTPYRNQYGDWEIETYY